MCDSGEQGGGGSAWRHTHTYTLTERDRLGTNGTHKEGELWKTQRNNRGTAVAVAAPPLNGSLQVNCPVSVRIYGMWESLSQTTEGLITVSIS